MSTETRGSELVVGARMLGAVRMRLAESGAEPTPAQVAAALRAQGRLLGDAEALGTAEELRSELVGTGPPEPLLADPLVTDVLVTAPEAVWVDRGRGVERTKVRFPDAAAVRRLATGWWSARSEAPKWSASSPR